MTKAKPITPKSQASTPKGNLKGVKNTPIGKNKTPKFKATPTGKVTLINGTPKSAGKQNGNKTPKVKGNNSPAATPKNKGNNKQNTPNSKQNSPQGKKNTPKVKSPGQKSEEEQLKTPKIVDNVDNEDDSDDSDEDINEGVQINEDISDEEADSDAEDESDDDGIEGILGNSLADDSDDDDVDFDDDDDDEDDETENKGVKRFKGLQPAGIEAEKEDEDEEEEEEDSSGEDEDDDDDSLNDSGPGLKALLKKSLIEDDDDDDEDFSENDEEEDEDDDDISDEEEDEQHTSPVKKQKVSASAEDEDEDDDDEEDEDSEDAEDDTETSKLSTLEEGSDDDDDEEDENESEEEVAAKSKKDSSDKDELLTPEELEEREKRSIYVGNLPKDVKKGTLMSLFKQFGAIETLRFRGAVAKDGKTSKKVAIIKREIHPVVPALHAYIRFTTEAAAKKALALNGHKLDGFYLRVDLVRGESQKLDTKKAVFLGNLPFKIADNLIWEHFADCGKIVSVRIVRDKRTGVGKGFGYVNFDTTDSVALALKLNGTTLETREIRVQVCSESSPNQKKQKGGGQKRPHPKSNQGSSPKKFKDNSGDRTAIATHNSQNAERRKEKAGKQQKRSQGEQQRQPGNGKAAGKPGGGGGGFQGQKADNKKKQKFNKFDNKKKQVAAKLAAKPKKPSTD